MTVVLAILALALAIGCGAYLIHSVSHGRPWALELVRAMGQIPAPAASRMHPPCARQARVEEEAEEEALAA